MSYRWSYVIEPDRHQWVLKRNCALRPCQLGMWFATIAAVSLAIALLCAASGAWLVIPFALAEAVALAAAFVVYARHAGDYERIVATPESLLVESGCGVNVERLEREGRWVRVEYDGGSSEPIRLVAGREKIAIGRFVPDESKAELVQELRGALGAWRAA